MCLITFSNAPFLIPGKWVSEPSVKEVRVTDKGGGVKGAIAI